MERLKELRKERGLSQVRLGARAELDPSTVNQLERGVRKPSADTLEKLATALEVDVAELFPKAEAPESESGRPEEDHIQNALLSAAQELESRAGEDAPDATAEREEIMQWVSEVLGSIRSIYVMAQALGADEAQPNYWVSNIRRVFELLREKKEGIEDQARYWKIVNENFSSAEQKLDEYATAE